MVSLRATSNGTLPWLRINLAVLRIPTAGRPQSIPITPEIRRTSFERATADQGPRPAAGAPDRATSQVIVNRWKGDKRFVAPSSRKQVLVVVLVLVLSHTFFPFSSVVRVILFPSCSSPCFLLALPVCDLRKSLAVDLNRYSSRHWHFCAGDFSGQRDAPLRPSIDFRQYKYRGG